jgi:hypothetical protein
MTTQRQPQYDDEDELEAFTLDDVELDIAIDHDD